MFLWIAGGIIIAGVAAYGIYKFLQYQENENAGPMDTSTDNPGRIIIPDVVSEDLQHGATVTNPEQVQQDAATSIKERHQAAARHLRETLGEMGEDSAEFEERITQINDDLDKLLE